MSEMTVVEGAINVRASEGASANSATASKAASAARSYASPNTQAFAASTKVALRERRLLLGLRIAVSLWGVRFAEVPWRREVRKVLGGTLFRTIARVAMVAAILGMWWNFLAPVQIGGNTSAAMVSGKSMLPTLHTNDLIFMQKQASYQIGDVVGYEVGETSVVHRLIGGSAAEGWIAQGDNNIAPDPWVIPNSAIVGKMVVELPQVGAIWAQGPEVPPAFAVLFGAFLLVPFGWNRRLRHAVNAFVAGRLRRGLAGVRAAFVRVRDAHERLTREFGEQAGPWAFAAREFATSTRRRTVEALTPQLAPTM